MNKQRLSQGNNFPCGSVIAVQTAMALFNFLVLETVTDKSMAAWGNPKVQSLLAERKEEATSPSSPSDWAVITNLPLSKPLCCSMHDRLATQFWTLNPHRHKSIQPVHPYRYTPEEAMGHQLLQ